MAFPLLKELAVATALLYTTGCGRTEKPAETIHEELSVTGTTYTVAADTQSMYEINVLDEIISAETGSRINILYDSTKKSVRIDAYDTCTAAHRNLNESLPILLERIDVNQDKRLTETELIESLLGVEPYISKDYDDSTSSN